MSRARPGVPRLLVRLKVRLLRNRARAQRYGTVFLVGSVVAALVFGLYGAIAVGTLVTADDAFVGRGTLVIGATLFTLAWTVLPLITFGADESLDPARLTLLPLHRDPLMRGLLLASLVGPAPAFALLVLLGAVIGFARTSLAVVPVVVLLVLFTVALARTVSTLLAATLASRKARDAVVIILPLLFLSLQALRFVNLTFLGEEEVGRISDVLMWLPPGMLGQAVYDAGGGDHGPALLRLLPAMALLPALVWVWGRALDRTLTTGSTGETSSRRRRPGGDLPLLFPRLGFIRPTPWGAVAARELRYVLREPRHKVNLVNTILLGAGLPLFFALRSGGDLSDSSVLLATVAGYLAILSANNQFGLDGGALWLDIVAGDTIRSVLIGKNLAVLVQVLPTITVVGVVMAAITGGWAFLPGALVLGVAALGSGLATADVISIRFPLPVADTRNPFGGAGGGQGCATGLILFVCTLVQAILVIPVGIAAIVGIVAGPAWLVLAAIASAAYGVGLWFLGLRLAADHARAHEPERLRAVDSARSS